MQQDRNSVSAVLEVNIGHQSAVPIQRFLVVHVNKTP